MATKEQFVREYTKAIRDETAAVFAGAGLSRSSGFVLWKELLRPLAQDIGLNIDEEYDLTAVAQYVRNKKGNRAAINSEILEAYGQNSSMNENVSILTRLPICTYWTTNYDHLIEDGLRNANRNVDVKIDSKQLSNAKKGRDAVVYKMHGDAEHAADAVLTKDDYARYDRNYPFFRNILQGDLLSKTFVFIGFSFEDPNLDCILGQLRLLLGDNIRTHYCFMKRVVSTGVEDKGSYAYKKARQDLREEDLKRFGIQTIFVDDYAEITEILREVENAILANNVFISGSAEFFEGAWGKPRIEELAYKLANHLVKEDFRVASGFGLGIGSSVINGALDEIYNGGYKRISEYLSLHPFPQGIADSEERKEKWRKYREDIIETNGVAVFIMGNKKDNGRKAIADGCLEEFKIAKKNRCVIIPIGSTGDAAGIIYNEIKENRIDYPYLENYLDVLETETDVDVIVGTVVEIIKKERLA